MDCEKALELMSAELDGMCTEQERAALYAADSDFSDLPEQEEACVLVME